jgi:hypothetical protein
MIMMMKMIKLFITSQQNITAEKIERRKRKIIYSCEWSDIVC